MGGFCMGFECGGDGGTWRLGEMCWNVEGLKFKKLAISTNRLITEVPLQWDLLTLARDFNHRVIVGLTFISPRICDKQGRHSILSFRVQRGIHHTIREPNRQILLNWFKLISALSMDPSRRLS